MIYNENESRLSQLDWESLNNMASITVDDVVDIEINGTLGKPYSVNLQEWKGCYYLGLRKVYQALGAASTKRDIPHIQKLFDRVVSAHMRGGNVIELLSNSLHGLKNLQLHYEKDGFKETSGQIEVIIQKAKKFLNNPEKFTLANFQNEGYLKRMDLDASIIGDSGGYKKEGVLLYNQKIDLFLTSQGESLSSAERTFLDNLKNSLNNAPDFEIKTKEFYLEAAKKASLNYPQESNDLSLWKKMFSQAKKDLVNEKVTDLFIQLQNMDIIAQSQVGCAIPMSIKYSENKGGHAFFLSLCKEKDETFTIAQINTGSFALGLHEASLQMNWLIRAPLCLNAPPVVEFSSLSEDEATLFLEKALRLNGNDFKTSQVAEENYNNLFTAILNKKTLNRIPARRLQITGNCSTRSTKEYLIYCFQKSQKIELGNKFLSYLDSRNSYTLSLEPIQVLKE